jgi:GNAT superfamily N-acetyltransferase
MKDIPMFTTDNGVASLVLKEIPVRSVAYVKLITSQNPEALLGECVDFCRACGAEAVFASGDPCLAAFPLVAVLIEMTASGLAQTDAAVFPVTEETVGRWRQIYNERMANVPNAAYMTAQDEKRFLGDGDCYFVHKAGTLLGIGKASGDTIELVAGVQPGAGQDVTLALASVLTEERVRLTVARENKRAVRLYERLGFSAVQEVSRWYKIF